MIEHLRKLPTELVERFLELRDAKKLGIPEKLGNYILQLNMAANLNKKIHSISECAKRLQEQFPELSLSTCKSRIYDAINYLNDGCSVTSESWNLYYADMFMRLFEVNIVSHNMKEARTCLQKARDYRIIASDTAVDPDRIRFKQQIVSPDIMLDRMGVKKKGLLDSYNKAMNIIESLEATDGEKERLAREVSKELNISDTPYEEVAD